MEKFLLLARKLALLTPTAVACASSTPAPGPTPPPSSAASASATSASATESAASTTAPPVATGPCRCSWDTNAAAAERVCKKGEANYEGIACVPGNHPKYKGPIKGPLPPPDLPAV